MINSACIILYDAGKRFLLQHRSLDAERMPGYWAFFGGGIEDNETPTEAVYRETFEELCYNLKNPEFVFEQDFKLDTIDGHMKVYIDAFEDDVSSLRLQEGQDWGWYTAEETERLKMIEHDRRVIEEVSKYLDKTIDKTKV